MAYGDGYDSLGRKVDEYGDRKAGELASQPGRTLLKWGVGITVFIICVSLIFGAISWVGSWGNEVAEKTGPRHSEQAVTSVLQNWTNLQAQAQNYCDAKNSPHSVDDPVLVEKPEFAYAAKYRQTEATYDRQMNNFFEAYLTRHLPIPGGLKDLPRTSPTLKEATVKWC